jgi:hypothetical protein
MIQVPKDLCPPCEVTYEYSELAAIPPIETCPPCEPENEDVVLTPIVSFLCPCPEPPEPVMIPVRKKIKSTIVKLCYKEFILAISTTKLCETGPQCRPGV